MRISFLLAAISVSVIVHGQTPDSLKNWKYGGIGTLNLSQVSFNNWAAGGENSFSATALFNVFANFKKGKTSWENSLDLTYGLLRTDATAVRKSDDKIDLSSKWGHQTGKNWHYACLVNFKSQFSPGFNYPNDSVTISEFMSPAYLILSTGMDYKPVDWFSFFMSPLTGKITMVNNQTLANAGAFGVQAAEFDSTGAMIAKGEKIRYEFGAMLAIKLKKEIAKNILLATKFDLFSNYLKDPQNMDINWDLLLTMKVNKYVSASINTTLIYDHDVPVAIYQTNNGVKTQIGTGPRTQFKEVFALGFSYKF